MKEDLKTSNVYGCAALIGLGVLAIVEVTRCIKVYRINKSYKNLVEMRTELVDKVDTYVNMNDMMNNLYFQKVKELEELKEKYGET